MAPFTTLNRQDAQELVRELADMSWPVHFKKHAIYRSETRNVTQAEVHRALLKGSVVEDPYWDGEYLDWKVHVEATLDDVLIKVHIAIDEERPGKYILHVIT